MHQNCIKWHLKLICLKCFKTKEGRLTLSDKTESSVSGLLSAVTYAFSLFFFFLWQNPSFCSLFSMCSVFSSNPKSQWRESKEQLFNFSPSLDCSSGCLITCPSPSIGELKKVLKIENSEREKHKTTKQIQVIWVWLMRIVWSSSAVKTCASGIWWCREEDSWPAWWPTPSTGKAKSWWTTSLREQTEIQLLSYTCRSVVLWLNRIIDIQSSNARGPLLDYKRLKQHEQS